MKQTSNNLFSENELTKSEFFNQNGHKIILKEKSINHFVDVDTITHLICDCYLTTIYLDSGKNYVVSKLLKDFESKLTPYGFVRVNRNAIINTSHLVSCGSLGSRKVLLTNNASVEVSRRGMARLRIAVGL